MAAFPEDRNTSCAVQTNSILKNPISKRDSDSCNEMLGKSKCIIQGKRTMRSSDPINVDDHLIELPPTIKNHYRNVQLAAETLCVNNVLFLASIANHIHHVTYNAIDNLKYISLEEGVKNVIRYYALRGFKVVAVILDVKFKCLNDQNKLGVPVNVVSMEEHAKQIERFTD